MQTVSRAVEVLNFLSTGPKTLIEVTNHLGTHKSTILRLLQTLERSKYTSRDDDGKWMIGTQFIQIANTSINSLDVRSVARPYLKKLEHECGHTVHLAQLLGKDLVYIEKIEGSDNVLMYSRIGKSLPIHASAIGKAIYSFLDEVKRGEIDKTLTFQKFTPKTLTNKQDFAKEIKKIQKKGWSADNGEFEANMNCIAVPVFDEHGRVRMGISISTLKVIAPESKLKNYLPALTETAESIAKELSFSFVSRSAI